MILDTDKLRFLLLPSANPPAEHRALHDTAYRLWHGVWTQTFSRLGLDSAGLAGEFVRQDLVACLVHEQTPIAVHLYSFFNVQAKASKEHPYLSGNYPEMYFTRLATLGVRTVMSMEYMTVHPEFRKGSSNLHVGAVLAGLALTTLKNFGADAAIAPARRDHKVHELAHAFGGESLISNVLNHNVPCDLLLCRNEQLKPHSDAALQGLIDRLWLRSEYYPCLQPTR